MGTVYAAVHEEDGQRVAVKMLAPELAKSEGFRERFEAEIESLRTLRHPNIVRLFGYGEEDGALYYSMELIDGVSLEEELRAGRRFDWREVTRIAIQVSRALKHAHDHGIIHRDI
ncbi:MAG: serine/threonine protein kinase, partial [Planctomycetales bacterium]|nr:serine/threonine protein kinase [Planctomycetales bacterium]